jgi:hypothetical protein
MVWKKVPAGDTGDANKFGGDDTNKISDLFSGVDVDDVTLNADTEIQKGLVIKEQAAPGSPTSGKQIVYLDSGDSKIKRKSNSGAVSTFLTDDADNSVTGELNIAAELRLSGRENITLTGTQNNLAVSGDKGAVRLNPASLLTITGIAISGGNTDGDILVLHNVSTVNVVLNDDDSGSTAANRILLNGNQTLLPDQSCALWYDSTSSRWRLWASSIDTSGSVSPGGSSGDLQYNNGAGGFGAESDLNYDATNNQLKVPGIKYLDAAKTSNYTIVRGDSIIRCDASAGAFTITLPAAATAGAGAVFTIIREDTGSSTNLLTIDGNGAELIDGAADLRLVPGESIVLESNGTNFITKARTTPSGYNGYYFLKNSTNNRRIVAGVMSARSALITSTTTPGANQLWAFPFIVAKVTKFDTISFAVTTGEAQNARAGIYYDNGNFYPGALIFDTGSISVSSTGVKDTTITASLQVFQPGLYWLVWETSATTTLQIRSLGNTSTIFAMGHDSTLSTTSPGYGYKVAHTFGALPNPYTASATMQTADPAVGAPQPAIGLRPI